MNSKNKKINFILAVIFLMTKVASGQEVEKEPKKSEEIQWNVYKKEIALDFQYLDKNLSLG